MIVFVLDAGNSVINAKIARHEQGKLAFPHDSNRYIAMES